MIVATVLLLVVGLVVISATAYAAGRDASDSAIDCEPGDVLSIHTSVAESDNGRTIDRTLRVGKCERIGDQAFSAALTALAPSPDASEECATQPATTGKATTTSATFPTTTSPPGSVPPRTAPSCPPS